MSEYIHVSVAWPYANGDLHVGHLAGALLPSDIFARYHRLAGNKVLMVSGSDTHGTPIQVRADKENISAKEVYLKYHKRFLETQQKIGISYDLFTHTDTKNHHMVAQDLFKILLDKGYLFIDTQRQFFSETQKRFLPDRYIEGTCPKCGYAEARGDQCDRCGTLLDPTDLINPYSKVDGSTPILKETTHYFFDLRKLEDALKEYLGDKDYWRPNVINFSKNYLDAGLKPRPITRDIDWGIPVPLQGWENKTLYVWFEAVMGYLTGSIEWAKNKGMPDAWKDWWYNPSSKIYNFIGKDNIPFHSIIWAAILLGVERVYEKESGKKLNLPYDIPSNEFMTIGGGQFSKSRGRVISIIDLLQEYDPDVIRYYLAKVMPESNDTEFSWEDFISSVNNEVIATWGNLANRVTQFTMQNFNGKVPQPGALRSEDLRLFDKINQTFEKAGEFISNCHLKSALREAIDLARDTNRYLDKQAPWFEIKSDKEAAATSIYCALNAISALRIIFAPFIPFSSERLNIMLGYKNTLFGSIKIRSYSNGDPHDVLEYSSADATGEWKFERIPIGQELVRPTPLFQIIELPSEQKQE